LQKDYGTVLVLSGETTLSDVEKSVIKPNFVFDNIKKLFNVMTEP